MHRVVVPDTNRGQRPLRIQIVFFVLQRDFELSNSFRVAGEMLVKDPEHHAAASGRVDSIIDPASGADVQRRTDLVCTNNGALLKKLCRANTLLS